MILCAELMLASRDGLNGLQTPQKGIRDLARRYPGLRGVYPFLTRMILTPTAHAISLKRLYAQRMATG